MAVKYVLEEKTYAFSLRIIDIYKHLTTEKHEYVLSKQVLRSGTAIGALVREAKYAQSRADMLNKYAIALKEANETLYWLELLHDSQYLEESRFTTNNKDCNEITAILVSTVNKLKLPPPTN